ncbi:MAG: OstA-like protein [bacterium]
MILLLNIFLIIQILSAQADLNTFEESLQSGEPFSITAGIMSTRREEGDYYLYLSEGVKIIHGDAVITGDSGFADQNSGRIEVIGNVRIVERQTVITSKIARYWKFDRIAEAIGSAHLVNGNQEIFAHHLSYFRNDRISSAYINVIMRDKENNTELKGDTGIYFLQEDYGIIYGSPELYSIKTDDTLVVSGDTMENFADSGYYVVTDQVEVNRGEMTATGGKMFYYPHLEIIELFGDHPKVETSTSQLWGDSIVVWLKNENVDQLESWNNAGGNLIDSNSVNYISGDRIYLSFDNGKPQFLEVNGNVVGQYLVQSPSTEDNNEQEQTVEQTGTELQNTEESEDESETDQEP